MRTPYKAAAHMVADQAPYSGHLQYFHRPIGIRHNQMQGDSIEWGILTALMVGQF